MLSHIYKVRDKLTEELKRIENEDAIITPINDYCRKIQKQPKSIGTSYIIASICKPSV